MGNRTVGIYTERKNSQQEYYYRVCILDDQFMQIVCKLDTAPLISGI